MEGFRKIEPTQEKSCVKEMLAMCLGKNKYSSYDLAECIRRKVWHERRVKSRSYWCPYCNNFHITCKEER